MSQEVATTLSASTSPLLSPRELEVLQLCSRGMRNLEIGQRLGVTVGTVKGHLVRIYRKLEVRNRTGAVAKARQLGLMA